MKNLLSLNQWVQASPVPAALAQASPWLVTQIQI